MQREKTTREMDITLTVDKSAVMKKVAQTTAYVAAKMTDNEDEETYDRIVTVDEDADVLEEMWDESRVEVARVFKGLLAEEGMEGDNYHLTLNEPENYNTGLRASMKKGLVLYFVQSIVAQWFMYTNKGEAAAYAEKASAQLEYVRGMAYDRKYMTRSFSETGY